jgi:hypothetical protein
MLGRAEEEEEEEQQQQPYGIRIGDAESSRIVEDS